MSSIFDNIQAPEQTTNEVETVTMMETLPAVKNSGCGCKKKKSLEDLNTKLSIIVSLMTILFLFILIINQLRK